LSTAAASAAVSVLPGAALLLADDPAAEDDPAEEAELAELEPPLDEQAASSTAAPTASTPEAIRAVWGVRLFIRKFSMRPRICIHPGRPDHTAPQV
jgi:hypothetical protein